jgi:hypothetical protein
LLIEAMDFFAFEALIWLNNFRRIVTCYDKLARNFFYRACVVVATCNSIEFNPIPLEIKRRRAILQKSFPGKQALQRSGLTV